MASTANLPDNAGPSAPMWPTHPKTCSSLTCSPTSAPCPGCLRAVTVVPTPLFSASLSCSLGPPIAAGSQPPRHERQHDAAPSFCPLSNTHSGHPSMHTAPTWPEALLAYPSPNTAEWMAGKNQGLVPWKVSVCTDPIVLATSGPFTPQTLHMEWQLSGHARKYRWLIVFASHIAGVSGGQGGRYSRPSAILDPGSMFLSFTLQSETALPNRKTWISALPNRGPNSPSIE
jgi:hypothetical protein